LLLGEPVAGVVVLDNYVRGAARNLRAVADDPRLDVVEGSINDRELLKRLTDGCDYVFHLAALWLHECVHEPRKALEVNVEGTFNVAEAAQEAGVRKVVYSSSASVYGDARELPMTEEHPFDNRTMYGATKIAGEQIFRSFNEQHGLDWAGLRYMNVYGPRMDYLGTYVSVIMKVLDKIDAGERPLIFGDGSQAYDFVHVRDVARANLLALQSDASDELFNVGTGVQTTVKELVDLLIEISGSAVEPEYLPQEQMFVKNRVGSTKKAEELLGFHAGVSLEDGLSSVARWREQDQRERAAL
jgi:UDP-glucose 4-epimerase